MKSIEKDGYTITALDLEDCGRPPPLREPIRWCGRDIDSMSREELVDALKRAGRVYTILLEQHIKEG